MAQMDKSRGKVPRRTGSNLRDQQLTEQRNPEPGVRKRGCTSGHIGRDGSGAGGIGTECTSADGRNGTEDLRGNQGKQHVHTGQGLKQNDTDTQTLDRVQDTQPQPETARGKSTASVTAHPGKVVANTGDGPPDLDESRCTQTTGEHGKEPAVCLGVSADDEQEDAPHKTEEDDTQDDNLPCVGVNRVPQD